MFVHWILFNIFILYKRGLEPTEAERNRLVTKRLVETSKWVTRCAIFYFLIYAPVMRRE